LKKEILEAGRIINTHGVRGEIKFEHWCDSPESLKGVKLLFLDAEGQKPLHITSVRTQNKFLLIKFEEINDLNTASLYKQRTLYVSRNDIKVSDGAVFIEDLIGLPVFDSETGRLYGHIKDVFNRGAGDIYEIEAENGSYLFPAVPEFLISVDTEKGVTIKPPKGIFDDEE